MAQAKTHRRPKGAGNVYQRNGRWVGRLNTGLQKPDGKPIVKYFSGRTQAEVNQAMFKYNSAQDINPDTSSVEMFMKHWMVHYKKDTVKASSYDALEVALYSRVLPEIGMIPLSQLTTADCQQMINNIVARGLSYSSVQKARDVLKMGLNVAVHDHKIPFNPMDGVVLPTSTSFEQKELQVFTPDEVKLIVDECGRTGITTGTPIYKYADAYILDFNTGLRMGEILALTKDDWDRDTNTLYVSKSIQAIKKRNNEGDREGGYELVTTPL